MKSTANQIQLLSCVGAAIFIAVPAAYGQNLVVNPSFEDDDYSNTALFSNYPFSGPGNPDIPDGQGIFVGSNGSSYSYPGNITGWTKGLSIEIYQNTANATYTQAPGGGLSYLDLVGAGPRVPGSAFFISQVLTTTPGQTYSVSFQYGENIGTTSGQTVEMSVSLTAGSGTGPVDFSSLISWTLTANATSDPQWRSAAYSFTASSTQTELKFLNVSQLPASFDPNYTYSGATLDLIRVEAVPEAGTWGAGLAALGLAGLARWQSARRARAMAA